MIVQFEFKTPIHSPCLDRCFYLQISMKFIDQIDSSPSEQPKIYLILWTNLGVLLS